MTHSKNTVYPDPESPSTPYNGGPNQSTFGKYPSEPDLKRRKSSAYLVPNDHDPDDDGQESRQSKLKSVGKRLFSIRIIFMAVVVLMIVAAGVSAWYLSWSNGEAVVADMADKYRSSILERVRDRLNRKFTELRDLSTIDRSFWHQHGYNISSITSMKQFTDTLWLPQLTITDESVARTQSVYSAAIGWAVILNTPSGSTSSFVWSIVSPSWPGKIASFPFVPALPQKGRELPNVTVVPFSPQAFTGVQDYIVLGLPAPAGVFMGKLEQTGVPGVFSFGLYQPASWIIRHPVTNASIGFGSKSISTNELQLFLSSVSDIPDSYAFIADRTTGLLVAGSKGDVFYIGTRAGSPAYVRIPPSRSTVRQISDGGNELISRYGSLSSVPSTAQFSMDSSEQYFVGASVFTFFEMDWLVCVMIPRQAIMGRIDTANQNTLITVMCIVVASVFVAVILTHFVAKPLDRLGKQMIEISQLQFPTDDSRKVTFYEISQLQSSFDAMQKGIHAFSLYVPSNLVRQILKTHAAIGLGMDPVDLTVLFCDVKSFTSLSEALPPDQLVEVMSEFLEEFSAIIQQNGGTIDKYIGDCIMAFFNAPEPVENHPRCAITAVEQCLRRLTHLQTEWRQRGLPELDCRIGLHSGSALCGNFGSKSRFNFTVIGDTVNLASRLESLCKQFDVQTLFSSDCVISAGFGVSDAIRPLGKVQVVGKQFATGIYSLVNTPGAPEEVRVELKLLFQKSMEHYFNREFEATLLTLTQYEQLHGKFSAIEDKPCRMYMDICRSCLANGVDSSWNGVLVMDEK